MMEFLNICNLLDVGFKLYVEFEKMTYTIKLGSHEVSLSVKTAKALSSNQFTIRTLLSEHFIQRGVMWQDFRRETLSKCIDSVRELQKLCQDKAKGFGATKKDEDQVISGILQAWGNKCDEAAKTWSQQWRKSAFPKVRDWRTPRLKAQSQLHSASFANRPTHMLKCLLNYCQTEAR